MKKNHIEKPNPLSQSPFSRSRVDIIVPFHGQYAKVVKLLESIWYITKSNPYLITLVDDASPNDTFIDQLKKAPQLQIIRSEKRLGFGGALEFGFQNTKQPWVCFLNSDCVIEDPNWLIELGRSLLNGKEQNIRMVSAKSNNPGSGTDKRLKATRKSIKGKDIVLKDGFLPLYCAMCHRDLFENIGGFIKAYPIGYYEDEELAYRMRHYGFKQAICGQSWIYHEGSGTIKDLIRQDPTIKEIVEKNREKCVEDLRRLQNKVVNPK